MVAARSPIRPFFLLCTALLLILAPFAHAQVTTGSIAGTVTAPDGSALPGVTVEAVHVPTGTKYSEVSGAQGRYTIPNVRVGGPYTITGNLEGFKSTTITNVQVALGSTAEVALKMQLSSVTEAIVVTATVDPVINAEHPASASQVSTAQTHA